MKTSNSDLLKARDMYLKRTGKYPKAVAVEQNFVDVKDMSSEELKKKMHEKREEIRNRITMNNGDLKRINPENS